MSETGGHSDFSLLWAGQEVLFYFFNFQVPRVNCRNRWFREFWEKHYNCRYYFLFFVVIHKVEQMELRFN